MEVAKLGGPGWVAGPGVCAPGVCAAAVVVAEGPKRPPVLAGVVVVGVLAGALLAAGAGEPAGLPNRPPRFGVAEVAGASPGLLAGGLPNRAPLEEAVDGAVPKRDDVVEAELDMGAELDGPALAGGFPNRPLEEGAAEVA